MRCVLFIGNERRAACNTLLSEETRVKSDRIRPGDGNQRDFDKFVGASREMASVPGEGPALTMSAMRTRARRLKRTKGLALVVVDYLQLMRPAAGTKPENLCGDQPDHARAEGNRQELEVPVLALSQLSRQVENREASGRNCPISASPEGRAGRGFRYVSLPA